MEVWSKTGAHTAEQMLKLHGKLDADGDGKASLAETVKFALETERAASAKEMSEPPEYMDADQDGKLSLAEYLGDVGQSHVRRELEEERFRLADADASGFAEEAELKLLLRHLVNDATAELESKHFINERDTDGDGLLTQAEYWGDNSESGPVPPLEAQNEFEALDKDGSGKLDRQEMKLYHNGEHFAEKDVKVLFTYADKDADSHVTAEELAGAREELATEDVHWRLASWLEHHEL